MQGMAKAGGLEGPVQRMGDEMDEDMLQGKAAEGGLQHSLVQRQEAGSAGGNGGLPGPLKSGIENLSGVDMSDVKVHYNSSKPAQLNALFFNQEYNYVKEMGLPFRRSRRS